MAPWNSVPTSHAWVAGLWVGAGVASLTVGGPSVVVLAIVGPGALMDFFWSRKVTTRMLTAACLGLGMLVAAAVLVALMLPSPTLLGVVTAAKGLLYALVIGLVAGERAAAHGAIRLRDGLVAAALGYLLAQPFWFTTGPEAAGAVAFAWIALFVLVAIPLPLAARVSSVALAAIPCLALGKYVDGMWWARAVEAVLWLAYAGLSWQVAKRGQPRFPPDAANAGVA